MTYRHESDTESATGRRLEIERLGELLHAAFSEHAADWGGAYVESPASTHNGFVLIDGQWNLGAIAETFVAKLSGSPPLTTPEVE